MIAINLFELNRVVGGCDCHCIDTDPGMADYPRYFGIAEDRAACFDLCEQSGRQYVYGGCIGAIDDVVISDPNRRLP